MGIVIFLVSLILSAVGIYLIGRALWARSKGVVVTGEVIGYQKKRDKGRRLPVILFEDASGVEVTSRALYIDSMIYWIKPAETNEQISVLAERQKLERCSVHGYMSIVGGFFAQWPILFYLVSTYMDEMMQGRLAFIFVLFSLIGGAWLFLRFVRYHYS